MAKKLSASDIAKRNKLVIENLRVVPRIAKRLAKRLPPQHDFDDLSAAGVFGLLDAATTFDETRNVRFSQFASSRIHGAMLDHLRSADSLSRDSRHAVNEIKRATREATIALGRLPDPQEIAAQLGITVELLYKRQRKLAGSTIVPLDDGTHDMLEAIADAAAIDPLTSAIKREHAEILEDAIRTLPSQMQTVLSLRYCEGLNHKEIGSILGFTESRSCQITKDATLRLREKLQGKLGNA